MKKIRLTKLNSVENPRMPTLEWDEYIPGRGPTEREGSPPVDYMVEGHFLFPELDQPKVGQTISFLRTNRNGEEVFGLFSTTMVMKIEGDLIYTKNSVYRLENLDDGATN